MKKTNRNQVCDNYIKKQLQSAYGYRDDQLEAEFDRAAAEPDDPNLQPPADEFDKILARLNAEKQEAKKIIRIKHILKPIGLVAILGITLAISGIGASGKRNLDYWVREKDYAGSDMVWNNMDNQIKLTLEEQAYQKIQDELGIEVLKFGYMPVGMEYQELEIGQGMARMEFEYKGEAVHLIQIQRNAENSESILSDCEVYEITNNKWIDRDITVYKKLAEKGKTEFLATIKNGKFFYRLDAMMPEDEFFSILQNLEFYEP